MPFKRYQYTGDDEIIVLETSEGAKVLSNGDTFLMLDTHDLTGRPFKGVGGVIPENETIESDPPAEVVDSAPAQEESE